MYFVLLVLDLDFGRKLLIKVVPVENQGQLLLAGDRHFRLLLLLFLLGLCFDLECAHHVVVYDLQHKFIQLKNFIKALFKAICGLVYVERFVKVPLIGRPLVLG